MLKQWWSLVELVPSIQRMQYCNLSPKHEGTMVMSFKVDVILGKITNNCLISWYHGTRFANLSKYTWLLSSLYQKGECFKDWQVMVGPSQTPLGGAATIESAVRSVLSPRLAHKTGLNRQKIITFLSHFVDKATKQPTKQAGYYCIAVTFLLPTKKAEHLQARDCCHAVTFLLPHRTVTFC